MTQQAVANKRRTQQERVQASDHAMLRAAIGLIVAKGPRAMTLAEVGKASGYSGGLATYRFGSKSGLLQAVSERILALWYQRVLQPALREASGTELLLGLARVFLDNVRRRSDLLVAQIRLMNASHTSLPELAPYFAHYDQRLRAEIAADLRRLPGLPAGLDVEAFVVAYIGLLRGVAMQYFINERAFEPDAVLDMIAVICRRTLDAKDTG